MCKSMTPCSSPLYKDFLSTLGIFKTEENSECICSTPATALWCNLQTRKVGSESPISFQGHPAEVFLEVQPESCLGQQNYITSPLCPMHVLPHSCSSNCEQGTHYSIFGVWILRSCYSGYIHRKNSIYWIENRDML